MHRRCGAEGRTECRCDHHDSVGVGALRIPVRRDVAMTGEISLRGRVMPIGGLKEKSIAAYRSGIQTVIIPAENEPDLAQFDAVVRDHLHFCPVKTLDEVLELALAKKAEIKRPIIPIRQRKTAPVAEVRR